MGFGEFKNWPKEKRVRLIVDLIELILERKIFLVGSGLLLDDYKTIPPVNQDGELLGGDKWLLPFQQVVMDGASQVVPLDKEESLAFFFDQKKNHEFKGGRSDFHIRLSPFDLKPYSRSTYAVSKRSPITFQLDVESAFQLDVVR